MWRKAKAGTLDALRERRKLRLATMFAPVVMPLLALIPATILVIGVRIGSLPIPLRRSDLIVHWANDPFGFILLACFYFFIFAAFTGFTALTWIVRKDRLEPPHDDFIAPTNFSNR